MNKEVTAIIKNLDTTLSGQPWFGRAIYELIQEADESVVHKKPGQGLHSLNELIWHMQTWAAFTLAQLEEQSMEDLQAIEMLDWRQLNAKEHTWKKGVKALKDCHQRIIKILSTKEDAFLKEMVPGRQYNFRFMLNGLIQHNIYHAGQIAQLNKYFSKKEE